MVNRGPWCILTGRLLAQPSRIIYRALVKPILGSKSFHRLSISFAHSLSLKFGTGAGKAEASACNTAVENSGFSVHSAWFRDRNLGALRRCHLGLQGSTWRHAPRSLASSETT